MIQITPHMRILVAVEAIDFRTGIDGLASLYRQRMQTDPFSGSLFVFRNRAHSGTAGPRTTGPADLAMQDGRFEGALATGLLSSGAPTWRRKRVSPSQCLSRSFSACPARHWARRVVS
jgi:hypothetical protein